MLHAINHKKTRLHLRYLGHRENGERRVHEEDEVTSLILGPLSLLPSKSVAYFWSNFISFLGGHLPSKEPMSADMSFWPRRPSTKIEPDIFVNLHWDDSSTTSILVELKWRSGLSGEDQLHRQWLEFLSKEERKTGIHLFLAPTTVGAEAARSLEDIWGPRLIAASWIKTLSFLHELRNDYNAEELRPWITQITKTMDFLSIRPFRGFSNLEKNIPFSEPAISPVIFFKEHKII